MSKKIYIGLIAGTLIGLAVPVILKYKRELDLFSDEDLEWNDNEQDYKSDEVNDYLLIARKKASNMVHEAELKSNSMLQEAAKILSKAKEKTSKIHYDIKDAASEEISKIKEEIEKSIEDFKQKLNHE